MPNGVILINKPTGMTSNTLVRKVGKAIGEKKVGHMGTLDPMGSGLLPVLCGKATRLFDMATNKTKVYRAVFKFGIQTDTLDSEGKITKQDDKQISKQDVEIATKKFVGEFDQIPPQYSSKKIGGKKAYEIARSGEEVELKPRHIKISKFALVAELEKNTFLFEIECLEGTYIRALCRDLAKELATCGTMCAICRTKCCGQSLGDAISLDEVDESSNVIAPQDFIEMPSVVVPQNKLDNLKNGIKIFAEQKIDGNFKLFCGDIFWGVATTENGYYKILRNFYGEKND